MQEESKQLERWQTIKQIYKFAVASQKLKVQVAKSEYDDTLKDLAELKEEYAKKKGEVEKLLNPTAPNDNDSTL